jgi:hypothetical protein
MHRRSDPLSEFYENDLKPALVEMRAWLIWLRDRGLVWLERIISPVFSYQRSAAFVRWLFLTLFATAFWVVLVLASGKIRSKIAEPGLAEAQMQYVACTIRSVLVSDIQKYSKEQRCYRFKIARSYSLSPLIFELPFQLLFDPGVFRRILVMSLGVWLAYKFAARYMEEIYELPDFNCGEHFLLQTALINPHNVLHIADGFVGLSERDLPIYRIGGPGKVSVHLENAALFEKIDGTPHVIGPTAGGRGQKTRIDGFERLRSIIDLRDQREKFNVSGRSQDGIRVTAEDVQVVYSVFRSYHEPSYSQPYPFQDPQAIENLVYMQSGDTWNLAVAVQIRGELYDFYARHKLNEFLTMVEEPELRDMQMREQEIKQAGQRISGEGGQPAVATSASGIADINFVSRPDITNSFYRSAEERSTARGTQINWVGVGTWRFPSQLILDRHREAWRISHENINKGKPAVLQGIQNQQRLGETLRLIQSIPVATYRKLNEQGIQNFDDILFNMILVYHQTMTEAYQDYLRELEFYDDAIAKEKEPVKLAGLRQQRNTVAVGKDRLANVLAFLSRFISHSLGGGAKI